MDDIIEQEKKRWSFAIRPILGKGPDVPTLLRRWSEGTGDELWISYSDQRNSYNLQFHNPSWNWGTSGWNLKGFLKKPPKQLKLNFYGLPDGSASKEIGDYASYHFDYILLMLGPCEPFSGGRELLNNFAQSKLITLTNGVDVIFSSVIEIDLSDFENFITMIEARKNGV